MSEDNFIRIQIVERDLVDWDDFIVKFQQRINAGEYPIRVKINEGPDLNILKVNDMPFVDYLCSLTKRSNIEIETDNLIQTNQKVKIIKFFNHLPFLAYQNYKGADKIFDKKLMQFVGCHRWPRFVLSQWLYTTHKKSCHLTYWFTHTYFVSPEYGSGPILDFMTEEQIQTHSRRIPLRINTDEGKDHLQQAGYIDWKDTNALLPFYDTAFLDMVCETWHEGYTFMPTEKIGRPLACKNPFLVYGPRFFLRNLKKLGFKTFEQFWSEAYDHMQGKERLIELKRAIDNIMAMDNAKLVQMYQEMLPILEHNYKVYNTLTHKKITEVFDAKGDKSTFN